MVSISKLTSSAAYAYHFTKFREGSEKGLVYFYNFWYPSLYYKGFRYIKDEVNAGCIVNEAFLKLWLIRERITAVGQIEVLIKKLIKDGCSTYFKADDHKFQRGLLRLDDIANYHEFIGEADPEYDIAEEICNQQDSEDEVKAQWERVAKVIPNLRADQQMLIRLSIKYSFDYSKIASYIGGISDRQVARKVEKTLLCLKAILTESQKLEQVGRANTFKFWGDVCEKELAILKMRYEMRYSFAEIATALNLSQAYVQQAFVNAMDKVKKVKK